MRCEKYKSEPLAMLPYLLLKKVWLNRTKKSQMKYIMDYKRSVPQLVSWKTNESVASVIDNKNNGKSMVNHHANVENIASVVKYIRNGSGTVREYQRRSVRNIRKNGSRF